MCNCTPCKECEGTGTVWVSMSGEYIGAHHLDDLDELISCEECRGTGVDMICDECLMIEQEDDQTS